MQILVNLLILCFIMLLIYQIFLAKNTLIEGLDTSSPQPVTTSSSDTATYQPYNTDSPNNALILAQQNAGNIEVLKQQMDGVMNLNQQVKDLSGKVDDLQTQVNGIVQAQQQYAQQTAPSSPPVITGAT